MNKDFIRDWFQYINKILPELENFINRDNILEMKKILLEIETRCRKFDKDLTQAYRKLIQGVES